MEFAEEVSKIPAWLNRPDHTVGHNHETKQKVCSCHGADQEVGWRVKLFEMSDGNDHKHISTHCEHYCSHHEAVHSPKTDCRPYISRTWIVNKVKAILHILWTPEGGWIHDLGSMTVTFSKVLQYSQSWGKRKNKQSDMNSSNICRPVFHISWLTLKNNGPNSTLSCKNINSEQFPFTLEELFQTYTNIRDSRIWPNDNQKKKKAEAFPKCFWILRCSKTLSNIGYFC